MGILEETNATAVRTIDFGLAKVDDLCILEEFRSVKSGLDSQDCWRTVFHH